MAVTAPPLVQLGRYTNLQLLGQGGMGAVYRAHDPALERTVAIKVILEASPEYLARFQREARAIAKLSHPHIVQVYDSGADERGNPYFVMELIDGQSLAALVSERGPLPAAQVVELLAQAAQGLAAAHEVGLVHRDIKPANLILDAKQGLKIVDFGIARLTQATEELTATQAALGTLSYMAPEVLNGQPADARADIYALGLSAFHLLTGRPPFTAPSAVGVAMKQLSEPLPDLTKETRDVPPELGRLIERMTQKNRDERVQTAAEVASTAAQIAARLAAQLSGQTTSPLGPPPRVQPNLPVLLLAGGLGLLGSVVLAIVLSGKARDKGLHHVLSAYDGQAAGAAPQSPSPEPPDKSARPRPSAPAPRPTGPVRVAVLRFKNLSGDKELNFFTEGLAEEAIVALQALQRPGSGGIVLLERNQFDEQNLPELQRSQTDYIDKSSAAQLGKVLGAEVVVQGTFQRVDSQLKVTARFTSLTTATILDTVTLIAPIATSKEKFAAQELVAARLKDKLQELLPRLRS